MAELIFKRLQLCGFGQYGGEANFTFANGVNVFIRPNEGGKTTMAEGLCAVLFGLGALVERYRHWGPSLKFEGTLWFSSGATEYSVTRRFGTNGIEVKNIDKKGRWVKMVEGEHKPEARKPNRPYLDFLEAHFGMVNSDTFRRSYFVAQPMPKDDKIDAKVQELLSGGGATSRGAENSLVEELKDLTVEWSSYVPNLGKGRTDRKLEALRKQREELTQSLAKQNDATNELEHVEESLNQHTKEHIKIKKQLEAQESLHSNFQKWLMLRERYDLCRDKALKVNEDFRQAERLAATLAEEREQLVSRTTPTLKQVTLAREDIAKKLAAGESMAFLGEQPGEVVRTVRRFVMEQRNTEDALRQDLVVAEAEEEQAKKSLTLTGQGARSRPNLWVALMGLLAGALSWLLLEGVAAGAVGLFFIVLGFVLALIWRKKDPIVLHEQARGEMLLCATERVAQRQRRYQEFLHRQSALQPPLMAAVCALLTHKVGERDIAQLAAIDEGTWVELAKKGDEYALLKLRRSELDRETAYLEKEAELSVKAKEDQLTHLLVYHQCADLHSLAAWQLDCATAMQLARREWQELVSLHSGLPALEAAVDAVALTLWQKDLAGELIMTRERLGAVEREIFSLRHRQGYLTGQQTENLAQGEEQLASLMAEENRVRREARVVGLAIGAIQKAATDFHAAARSLLEEHATSHFSHIAGGNREVVIDEGFTTWVVTECGHRVSPETLSQGARDQLYISLRLAIADLVGVGQVVPLVFDDPFLTTDQGRLSNISVALQNLGRQCLLLSHSDTFQSWGQAVGTA
ncbi:MAG: hypothetical protein DDT34_01068 [Firmicutes bacterium]|nr:hypothetical protein [Bacillota bacterium]